jgi:hypothetical protein
MAEAEAVQPEELATAPETPETTEATEETTTTALDSTDEVTTAGPADWPDDWRAKLAGEDDKVATRLGRFASPKAMWDSYTAIEKKMAERGVSEPFPAEGTDAEKVVWREKNDIPAKPSDYSLPDGMVVGEFDKPIVDGYLELAHEMNEKPAAVRANLDWYFKMRENEVASQHEQDDTDKASCQKELREEMGAKTQGNMKAASNFLDKAPEGVKDQLMGARLADGTALGNDPRVVRWLIGAALEIDPTAASTSGEGASLQSLTDEIAGMENLMKDRQSEYYKGPKGEDGEVLMQQRYRELVEIRDKVKGRS